MALEEVEAPPGSKKVINSIRLDNGLKAILISEDGIGTAAAAMLVRSGSFRDPRDAQGLAHLLEHMVFDGSDEYPDGNELSRFTTQFSKLFIHPQLKADVMVREIELLDSEFQLHRSDDMTRLEQLIASTAHKNLPFTKFSWGNKKSLSGNDFLHDQLLSMFKTYFVGASMNLVVHGSANISYYYTLEQSISGDYTHLSCNRQSVLDLLSFFTNSNMSLDFVDKSLDEGECLVESWFNSYYKQTKIPSTITGEWRLRFHANQRFQFPPKNNFLPSLSPNEDHLMIENDNEPLVHKSHIKLWHLPDNDEVPSVSFIVYPALSSELKNQLMVHLYVNHLKDSLSEILYQGGEANFETSILIFEKINIEFKVSGFKENLFNYISEIWKQFKSFTHPYETTFEMVKELVENLLKKSVLEVSGYSNNLMLQEVTESCYDIDQMLKSLSSISYDDFVQFIPHMSSKMFIEGLFKGDISKDESLHMSHLFEESVEIPCDQEYIHIPRGTNTKNVRVQVNSDINSYAEVTFQIGYEKFSAKKTAILKLFHAMIDHNLQDQLSAKEKLGYRVGSNVDFRYGINRFVINITSSVYDPAYLLSRIYNYVKTLEVSLEEVHEDTFKGHIEFLVQTCPDHDGDGDDLWDQITEKRFCQGFNKNLISELKEIRKKDVVRFVKKYLIASSSHSRILEVCIWGCKTSFPTSSV
ncbi:PREDICTED: nardilysin-like isoform X2 [Camelina sativa]|nr:PREDICTED: nardilysin-like isoform X2 [Camelina sativa]